MKVPTVSFNNSNSEDAAAPARQSTTNLPLDEGSAYPSTPSQNNATVPNTTMGQDSENADVTGSDNPLTSADTSAEVQDTSTFVSYGKKTSMIFDRTADQDQVLDMLRPSSEAKHTIETFLSRPVKVMEGIIPTDPNKRFAIVDILPTLSKTKIWADKLSGLYGFRAKANYKFVINAQPFEMGLINISFFPFARLRTDLNTTYNEHSQSLAFVTSLPNVILNISTQSEVVLSVDYTGPNAYINLTNPNMHWGQFAATTITRVKNLDNNNCRIPFAVYLYLTDIEYFGATPQDSVSFQMYPGGFSRRQQRREARQANSGNVVSSLIDAGSDVLKILLAGLSKPPQDQRVVRQELQPFGNPQLFDCTSNAIKLSTQQDQATDIAPLGVTPEDEMDIATIVKKPTYYKNIVWKTTDAIGTQLFLTPVEPNVPLDGTVKFDSTRSYVPNRVHGVANMFDYWRGSMVYTFHIAATNFHSGRISLIYAPGSDSTSAAKVYDNKHTSYYAVWDLRKGATFQISCPFISTTAWKSVPKYYRMGGGSISSYMFDNRPTKSGNFIDPLNWFYIFVETPLQTPSGSGELDIACFVSAGPDFEVAAPAALRNIPIMYELYGNNIPHKESQPTEKTPDEPVTFQSDNDVPRLLITAGEQEEPSRKSPSTSLTMGEEIRSLRAVIKRYQLVGAGTVGPNNIITFAPWAFRGGRIPAVYTEAKIFPSDHFSLIRSCYAFFRGGMRFLIHVESGPTKFLHLTYRTELMHNQYDGQGDKNETYIYYVDDADVNEALGANLVYGFVGWQTSELSKQPPMVQQGFPSVAVLPIVQTVTGGIEVEVPYYTKVHKTLVTFYDNDRIDQVSIDENNFLQPSGFFSIRNEGEEVPLRISRAAADDFNLGYFLGFPVHIANITTYWSIGQQVYQKPPKDIPKEK